MSNHSKVKIKVEKSTEFASHECFRVLPSSTAFPEATQSNLSVFKMFFPNSRVRDVVVCGDPAVEGGDVPKDDLGVGRRLDDLGADEDGHQGAAGDRTGLVGADARVLPWRRGK